MATSQVILKEKIEGLGAEADVVKVRAGYARNFLIPQGKAYEANDSNLRHLEALKAARAQREADELLAEAQRMAEHLASFAPFVPRTMKAMVHFGMEASLAGALMFEKYAQGALVQTEDKMEGITAFLDRRPPDFKGR